MAIVHPLLQPLQDDPHKAQAPLPVGIDAAVLAGQAYGQPLQAAVQNSDRHYQQQPIDASRIVLATAIQLEDPRFRTRMARGVTCIGGQAYAGLGSLLGVDHPAPNTTPLHRRP